MTNEGMWKELDLSHKLKKCKAELKRQKKLISFDPYIINNLCHHTKNKFVQVLY